MNNKWFKIGGIALSVVGSAIGIASDYIGRKNVVNDIIKSADFDELVAKKVAEILSNSKGA